ncbi:MAG: response regulator transcription factor [Arcobacteraceae bacterium]|jgi:DNA-binding response OmpR family regulator|nr:response regulator transcription factor [Arcobacteraceae bacterium]
MYTILAVEDDADILELIEYTLEKDGYDVIGCIDTLKVEQILDEENISLILMDRNLPNVEGSIFIESIRKKGYNQPVIYLTAKDSDDDILEGFHRGADDYITKPFHLDVLRARVKAVLKRTVGEMDIIKARDIVYKSSSKRFFIDNIQVELTHLEHDLLLELIKNKDVLLSRDLLLENVWGDGLDTKPKTVNVAIKRLKSKIDPTGEKDYIKSVRSEGYIFTTDNLA